MFVREMFVREFVSTDSAIQIPCLTKTSTAMAVKRTVTYVIEKPKTRMARLAVGLRLKSTVLAMKPSPKMTAEIM